MIIRTFIAILWASPYTLLGLFLGFIGLCTGGHARIRGRVIEFYGGGVKWLLQQFFFGEARWRSPSATRFSGRLPPPWTFPATTKWSMFASLRDGDR